MPHPDSLAQGVVDGPLPRWAPLPDDQPELRAWLTTRREEAAALEPLPPVPDGPR